MGGWVGKGRVVFRLWLLIIVDDGLTETLEG